MHNKSPRASHVVGERLRLADELVEITQVANTRWGSPTYQIRPVAGQVARWLTPRKLDEPASYIDRAAIERLVHRFYSRIQEHDTLASVFASRIGPDDWPTHLARMVHFWSAILLAAPGFAGNPMQKHRELDTAEPEHFSEWLALFRQVAGEVFDEVHARHVIARAERIADRLSAAMFGVPHSRAQCA